MPNRPPDHMQAHAGHRSVQLGSTLGCGATPKSTAMAPTHQLKGYVPSMSCSTMFHIIPSLGSSKQYPLPLKDSKACSIVQSHSPSMSIPYIDDRSQDRSLQVPGGRRCHHRRGPRAGLPDERFSCSFDVKRSTAKGLAQGFSQTPGRSVRLGTGIRGKEFSSVGRSKRSSKTSQGF